eukprot:5759596-Alexandrium_andersonii.AAC.1
MWCGQPPSRPWTAASVPRRPCAVCGRSRSLVRWTGCACSWRTRAGCRSAPVAARTTASRSRRSSWTSMRPRGASA